MRIYGIIKRADFWNKYMTDLKYIRNFSIIAHIDHGKSTLADRMLEITHTIEARKMRDQILDSMELERERGITIKMQPVRMEYTNLVLGVLRLSTPSTKTKYILNLIDTPGHIDFSYEVSRALKAREGGLRIIPVLSKIDSPLARIEEVKEEVKQLLGCGDEEVLLVSGKTGEGVENLLREVIKRVPTPREDYSGDNVLRALVFDFKYSNHKGVIVFVRILDGEVK